MLKLFAGILCGILTPAIASCDSPSMADKLLSSEDLPTASASKAVSSSPLAVLEASIHQQINQYRQSRNLPLLTLDQRISAQARLHSQAMASGKVAFSHQGFEQRIKVIGIRYSQAAENVAFNRGHSNPAKQAVQGWLNSKGHLNNIEAAYNLTGVGIVKNAQGEYYFTQIFIRS